MFSLILLIVFFRYLSIFELLGGLFAFWISFLLFFLQILFFTTCERKLLALTQRRIGPQVVGDRGRLQYFADALKLILKSWFGPRKLNSTIFQLSASAAFWFSWYGFSNLTFNYGEDIMEVEYNIFFAICCSLAFSLAWLIGGWSASSKYSVLGCIRAFLQIISYELLMGSIFLIVFAITGSVNFELILDQQRNYSIFLFMPSIAIVFFMSILMETNRPPFDLSEAESDVVAGYTTEYVGILFGLFYLGEYVNLFTNAYIIVLVFSGGYWSIFDYLKLFFIDASNLILDFNMGYTYSLSYQVEAFFKFYISL